MNPYLTWDLTFAQRLGATVSGSSNGLPAFWGPIGPGAGLFRGWNGMPVFGGPGSFPTPLPGWNGAPAFAGSGFIPAPYPVFVGGSSDYYPQQPSNVNIVLPPQFVAGPPAPPMPINEHSSGLRTFQASNGPVPVQETMGRELERDGQDNPSPDMSDVPVYQAPERKPVPQRAYPALIALKNGSALHGYDVLGEGQQTSFPSPRRVTTSRFLSPRCWTDCTRGRNGTKLETSTCRRDADRSFIKLGAGCAS